MFEYHKILASNDINAVKQALITVTRAYWNADTKYQRLKKKRAKPVKVITEYNEVKRLIKPPKYYYSVSGFYIFRKWYLNNGFNPIQAEIMVVLSHFEFIKQRDLVKWHLVSESHLRAMDALIEKFYVVRIEVESKSWRKYKAFALTQRGRDYITDYEAFYDKKIKELEGKEEPTTVKFNPDDYFRRLKVPGNIKGALKKAGKRRGKGVFNGYVNKDEVDWIVLTDRTGKYPDQDHISENIAENKRWTIPPEHLNLTSKNK